MGTSVREMLPSEADLRIRYFHDASDSHLARMGVDRASLPDPATWQAFHERDCARPLREREQYTLVWELDGRPIGFSSLDRIRYGVEAFMHLHVVEPTLRRKGLGSELVAKSVAVYFEVFELRRLYCEPNALNVAPNRTLQRTGFAYCFSHETVPGPLNFPQVTTRWVLEREA